MLHAGRIYAEIIGTGMSRGGSTQMIHHFLLIAVDLLTHRKKFAITLILILSANYTFNNYAV